MSLDDNVMYHRSDADIWMLPKTTVCHVKIEKEESDSGIQMLPEIEFVCTICYVWMEKEESTEEVTVSSDDKYEPLIVIDEDYIGDEKKVDGLFEVS